MPLSFEYGFFGLMKVEIHKLQVGFRLKVTKNKNDFRSIQYK